MAGAEHQHQHIETHFTATAAVRDIVIGMSDGLTVPFALAAGLTGAVSATAGRLIVTAGLAEIVRCTSMRSVSIALFCQDGTVCFKVTSSHGTTYFDVWFENS